VVRIGPEIFTEQQLSIFGDDLLPRAMEKRLYNPKVGYGVKRSCQ
jgi:hypothetical protein